MVISKYTLGIRDFQQVLMPKGAKILSVANQDGYLCMWAMVKPDEPMEQRDIEIYGTGNAIPVCFGNAREFIGTAVIDPFVWHVFERR